MDMAPQARFLVHTLLGVAFFLIALISVIYLVGWMRHSVVVAQVARRDKPTVEWIADLQGHEAAARGKAAEAIVQQGAPAVAEALDAIIAIQSDGSYRVVRLAVQALAARGTEIIQPLREALRSKRAGVRIGAVSVLREMGTKAKGAVRPLSDALGDDNRWVRRLAIESLGNCGAYAASATPQLIPLLTHEDRVTRLRTVIALTQIAPAAQVASDRLVAVRDHDADPEIRQAAVTALYQVDLERLAKEADEQASDEVRALVKRLAGKDPADRVLAARALGAKGLGALYAMPALAKALGDSDKWLREAAAKALGSMGDAAEPAVPNLQRLATDPEPDVQTAAQQALKEIRGKNL
jgi:HEAT repeat protein